MRILERDSGRDIALRWVAAPTAAHRLSQTTKIAIVICVLAVAARLILINQPYVDHWSWRQSDVAAIARNFLQNGFRFGFPQIDWAGNAPGYVGTEFPILPFIAAICYKFAGVHEWIGRAQALILFAVSLPFFFLLVRETWHGLPGHEPSAGCRCHVAAIWATFFYSFAPVNIFAGRSFMPDMPSLSLAIVGLYFFLQWTNNHRWMPFFLAAIAISLSLLIKITSVVVLVPLAYLAVAGGCDPGSEEALMVRAGRGQRARLQLILFCAIVIVPSAIWYWHAYQVAQKFYPHHFFGAGGIRIENFSWYWHIARETAISSLTPVLSLIALIGLFVPHPRDRKYFRLFYWWLIAMILFIIVVGYGNRHRWYQLPLVPIAAAFGGTACAFLGSKVSSRVGAVALSTLVVSSFTISAFWYVRPFYWSSAQLRDTGLELNKVTAPDALIVAADMGDPTIFYYAERKGWHFLEKDAIYNGNPDDSEQAIENLERLHRRGATHFVFTKNTFWWLQSYAEFGTHLEQHSTLIEATPEFRIYKLAPGAALRTN